MVFVGVCCLVGWGVLSCYVLSLRVGGGFADIHNYICVLTTVGYITCDQLCQRQGWRPKENVLVATLGEHRAAVNRLAVAQVGYYFIYLSF